MSHTHVEFARPSARSKHFTTSSPDKFAKEKREILQAADLSRKGAIDARIEHVVEHLNVQPQYYTTSSCSGRTVLLSEVREASFSPGSAIADNVGRLLLSKPNLQDGSGDTVRKKGCVWLNVSHELLGQGELLLLKKVGRGSCLLSSHAGSAVLKFEPFILHVRCHTLEDARKLLATSIGAGCRNSGIMISKTGSVHVAVRTTLSMEVPLSQNGNLLVSAQDRRKNADELNDLTDCLVSLPSLFGGALSSSHTPSA
ncbi:hypothetical protein HPB47_026470 [Ixodes persulcatus]|uniref:Uncharacterized protein n=1 Tax=Ixodes persulcatus TaxID=34615 RepID=A0AC60PYY9_IXOPE|nr:hypothetical protein HPB47_026470 [Ixodes persulcatus]